MANVKRALKPMTEEQPINIDVLAERVKGLTDVTNEKLGSIKETLTRIETTNLGYATKVEVEEVKKDIYGSIKRIEEAMQKHYLDDEKSFSMINEGQREVRDTILKWGAIGGFGLIVLSFLSPVILKYIFNV
jgi:DNA-binding ferritin-like protein